MKILNNKSFFNILKVFFLSLLFSVVKIDFQQEEEVITTEQEREKQRYVNQSSE